MAEYNPFNHSIVQACVGAWSRYEVDDFVEALFDSILKEIERVHWNVYQHQWGPSWHADEIENPEIDGISFVRFYQDRCDCGGLEPIHSDYCEWKKLRHEWNRRRLDAISDPDPGGFGRLLNFDEKREAAFREKDPPPPCTCGGEAAFDEDRGCLPTCIGQLPNFKHEDVEFRWYKYPGRGMSTNKDWSAQEWKDWHARCLSTIREFEGDHYSDENHERQEKLRESLRARYPEAFEREY